MMCPECGLDMMIYQVITAPDGTEKAEYVCRNKRCGRCDRRLTRNGTAETPEVPEAEAPLV